MIVMGKKLNKTNKFMIQFCTTKHEQSVFLKKIIKSLQVTNRKQKLIDVTMAKY